jgi:hypothetical protein
MKSSDFISGEEGAHGMDLAPRKNQVTRIKSIWNFDFFFLFFSNIKNLDYLYHVVQRHRMRA